MNNTERRAARAILAMAGAPKTDIKELEVIYYGTSPTYIRVTEQVAGSHRFQWGLLCRGDADVRAKQMLATPEYNGYTLKKTVR